MVCLTFPSKTIASPQPFGQEVPQMYIAFANASLSCQDDDSVLPKIMFNLVQITLPYNRAHCFVCVFYNLKFATNSFGC